MFPLDCLSTWSLGADGAPWARSGDQDALGPATNAAREEGVREARSPPRPRRHCSRARARRRPPPLTFQLHICECCWVVLFIGASLTYVLVSSPPARCRSPENGCFSFISRAPLPALPSPPCMIRLPSLRSHSSSFLLCIFPPSFLARHAPPLCHSPSPLFLFIAFPVNRIKLLLFFG